MITRDGPVSERGYSAEDFLRGVMAGIRMNGMRSLGNNLPFLEGLEAAVRKADELGMPLKFYSLSHDDLTAISKETIHGESDRSCKGGMAAVLNLPDPAAAEAYLREKVGTMFPGTNYIAEFRQVGLAFKEVFEKVGV